MNEGKSSQQGHSRNITHIVVKGTKRQAPGAGDALVGSETSTGLTKHRFEPEPDVGRTSGNVSDEVVGHRGHPEGRGCAPV